MTENRVPPKVPPHAQPTEVNGRIVDPHQFYAFDALHTDHIIVSTYGVLSDKQRTTLGDLKTEFLEDLGNENILCRYKPTDLEPLRKLEFVRQVDVYRNKYKIPAQLLAWTAKLEGTPEFATKQFEFDVFVHAEVTNLAALADSIASKTGLSRTLMTVSSDQIRLTAPCKALEDIAADDRVRIIEEVVNPILCDDEAKKIIFAPPEASGHPKYRGAGQTVAVYDSGFDLGVLDNCHAAFTAEKIKKLMPVARALDAGLTDAQRVDDPNGHGTHVCGTIVGREILTSQGSIGGVAQDAELVVSSLTATNGAIQVPSDLSDLYSVAYHEYGARVFSNSWGDGLLSGKKQKAYGGSAKSIDNFVRNHPDALVVFSAGNNNVDLPVLDAPTIGSQAAAKNCLTVGASGSTRHSPGTVLDKTQYLDPSEIVKDCSRGPTYEKRYKPDVVAPGFSVFSAHSRHSKARNFSGQEATSPEYPEAKWKARTGTSHSTPLVSGCAALLREVLGSQNQPDPPAALLKAVLINGATQLPKVDRSAQGFGRIDMSASVLMLQVPPLEAGKMASSTITQPAGTLIGRPMVQDEVFKFVLSPALATADAKLKVTLVYNDLPGAQIQNNLNLAVLNTVTDEIKHGGESEDEIDKQNNVEQVVWTPMPRVPLTIRVTAQKIFPKSKLVPNPEQDFALAWLVSTGTN